MKSWILSLLAIGFLSGCGQSYDEVASEPLIPAGASEFILKSQAVYRISTSEAEASAKAITPTTIPLTVVNLPSSNMVVDSTGLVLPTLTPSLLNFGSVKVTSLNDNDLRVCAKNLNKRCSKAVIRIYTTGAAGAGLYNAEDGYGVPITVIDQNSVAQSVGLGAAAAAVVQSLDLGSQNVLHLADFGQALTYRINVDFTNAGAGTYATSLVVEYGLVE